MSKEILQTATVPDTASAAPPAYFLSLTVENYRCFGPARTLDLSDGNNRPAPWTIILGENGVGKITLLQCLAALQPESEPRRNRLAPQLWHFDLLNRRNLDLSQWVRTGSKGEVTTIAHYVTIGATLQTHSQKQTGIQLIFNGHTGSGLTSSTTQENLNGLICYGYGASRRMGKSNLSEQRTEDTTASLFSDDVDLINAEEWLLQADYAAKSSPGNGKAEARLDQIKDILIALLPDVDDIRFRVPQEGIGTPVVEFQTPYDWVRLSGLSLGYRTLITWMVDLASRLFDRYPDSPNPLAEPAVVLVDEIDLHLHPRWQRTLMTFLSDRFPNAQFIATAHSPLVVQAATDANIVLLRRDGDHVVIENDMKAIQNGRVDQILTSDLFGLESARPPQIDAALAERTRLLSQAYLSEADEQRLRELEAQIGELPTEQPGYYWLAYDWDNLLWACPVCNQRGKKSAFPLANPADRARSHHDDIALEQPLLLHPAQTDPAGLVGFRAEVAYPIDGDARASATIQGIGLNRADLLEQRRDHLARLAFLRRLLDREAELAVSAEGRTLLRRASQILADAVQDTAEFAAMARSAAAYGDV